MENTLLGDEKSIRETVRQNRSLGEWVRDQIDRILAKLGNAEEQAAAKERQELRRIRDLYAQALRERSENKETAADSQREGEQYSIEELEDGTKFVEVNTDQHLFDGMTGHEMQAEVQRMINYRLKNTNFDTEVGTKYTALLGERTAGEYTHPRKRVPHNAFIAKLKASTELDNLLDASRYIAHKADDGHHPEATGGWDYYSTLFRVNGQMYRGRINIEITDDGPIFYNVTHIQRTQKGTTGNFVGTQPRAASPESSGGAGEIVSQDEPEVKDLSLPAEGTVQSSLTEEAEGVKDLSLPKVGDVQYSFASEEAGTANNDLLDTAKDLETRGVSSEEIRRSTGWFRGMDGKWRFEIDDSGMSVKLPEYAFNRLRDLTAEERRNTRPDIDRENVVFADARFSMTEEEDGTDGLSLPKIEPGDGEHIYRDAPENYRYNVLKDKTLTVKSYDPAKLKDVDLSQFETLNRADTKKLLRKIGEQFGVFKTYSNKDVEVDFNFSKNNMNESIQKQGGRYGDYAKMLTVFDDVIETAVGIEMHSERYANPGSQLKQMYVLASAFKTEDGIIPVQMEVKELSDRTENALHLTISLNPIKEADIVTYTHAPEEGTMSYAPSASEYRIADVFQNVNTVDGDMLKFIPDGFLTDEQKEAKRAAIQRTEQYIQGKNQRYQSSYTETEVKDLGLPMIGEPAQQSTEEPEVKDLGLPKIEAEETEETKKPKTRKKPPKPVAESKPIMARGWLNKKIMDSFGIRENKTKAYVWDGREKNAG